jgi:hypothetical protein
MDEKMKKLIIALIVILINLLFCSCEDIVNIGDPQKKLIIDPGEDPPVSTIFEIEKKELNFREMYVQLDEMKLYNWGNNRKFLRNSIKMDTSSDVKYIWIDLDVECTVPDKSLLPRNDRVTKFTLKLDSLTITKNLSTELYRDNSTWSSITIKDISNNNSYYYTNNDFNFMVILKEEVEGLIHCEFLIDFFRIGKYETTGFQGIIIIEYK